MTFDYHFPAAKSGVEPAGCVDLVKHVRNCQNLEFCGLMTIGMLDYTSTPENFKVYMPSILDMVVTFALLCYSIRIV